MNTTGIVVPGFVLVLVLVLVMSPCLDRLHPCAKGTVIVAASQRKALRRSIVSHRRDRRRRCKDPRGNALLRLRQLHARQSTGAFFSFAPRAFSSVTTLS
jgi:hypothetical protein